MKYNSNGIAIITTSRGSWTITFPFKLNITIIVNNSAMSVMGLIFGMNFSLYHSIHFRFTRKYLVNIPAINGIPRYMKTLSAICIMLMFTTLPCIPNSGGRTVMNIHA